MSYLNASYGFCGPFHLLIDKIWPLAAPGMDSISFLTTRNPGCTIPTRLAAFVDSRHFNSFLLSHWNSGRILIKVESGFW